MLTKCVIALILAVLVIFANAVFFTAIQPEVATELALEQFANPSTATDTAQRAFWSWSQFPYLWCGYGVVIFLMFWSDLRKGCSTLFSQVEGAQSL